MLKLITKILSLYFLFLAITPCLDNCSIDLCSVDGNVHIEESHNEQHNDYCSPLCICDCCNTVVTSADNFTFNSYLIPANLSQPENLDLVFHPPSLTSPPPRS
ncbi:MAG: DUF6660 family protein [Ignavibacteria bacterium]